VGPVSRGIDRIAVTFDEDHLVANAGLLLVATLTRRLGIQALVNTYVVYDTPCDQGFSDRFSPNCCTECLFW